MTAKIAEALAYYWGTRCADFDANCACCLAWAEFDAIAGVTRTGRDGEAGSVGEADSTRAVGIAHPTPEIQS